MKRWLSFFIIGSVFLGACATSPEQGSYTKSRYTQQKNRAPKSEPHSRYRNPTSYAVAGHRYSVMKNSKGYKAQGIASWYGTKFHQKRTSSGDHFNMYAMTAAHKTLPLPTYVRVKNLENGRVVVVKVNDRGPFFSNRLIDLSYAAGLKLGMVPKGLAKVEVETMSGNVLSSSKPVTQQASRNSSHYYIQAGTFISKNSADAFHRRVSGLTSSPVKVERYQKKYIVKLGPFQDKQHTDAMRVKLNTNGIKGAFSFVI